MSIPRPNAYILTRPRDLHNEWWSSTPIPTPAIPPNQGQNSTPIPASNTNTQSPNQSQTSVIPSNNSPSDGVVTITSTSTFPITTVTQPATTFTSFSESIVVTLSGVNSASNTGFSSSDPSLPSSTSTASAAFSSESSSSIPAINSRQFCIGDALDSSSEGILASLVLPSTIGLILWILFAIIRPRFRQIYALREWFLQQDLRPKPLGSGFFAFLFPHVPLVPPIPSDVTAAGRSAAKDAETFPSDELLNQRALWIGFLIALGWSVLGLAGALPLYLVSTPCIANSGTTTIFGGAYSTLQDLSLLRLLRLFDNGSVSPSNLIKIQARATGDPQNARVRVIVLTVLTLLLGLLPALWKIISEFNRLIRFRKDFTDIKCEGKELGWLSATKAPGFVGWGEQRLKDFIVKSGLSYSLGSRNGRNNGNGDRYRSAGHRARTEERQPLTSEEEANLEVDVQSLFSIGDTHALALLIEQRDEILENLEIAETRYIGSFRVTTPDPSIADFEPPAPVDPSRPYISRPLPLGRNSTRRTQRGRRRHVNPAYAASSLAPTSFVAPSQYYKLRTVRGVSGGRLDSSAPSLTESIHSRITGSRFLEVNRNSVYGRLPLGSHVVVDKTGQIAPRETSPTVDERFTLSPIPDPRRFGPNYAMDSMIDEVDELGVLDGREYEANTLGGEAWVDLSKEAPPDVQSEPNGSPGPSTFRRRPKKEPVSSARRETFPLRDTPNSPETVQPPHLRLQPSQPFVRPLEGIDFDNLGHVYADITLWRSKLKVINAEIAEAQKESYQDIADGARIKGWLMVGRGLRYIPGIQLIEGRAKEDIRWDVLQNERNPLDAMVFWAIIVIVVILLAVGLAAASGLFLATAPDVSHYITFLRPLLSADRLPAGIATVLAPAVAATLFTTLALWLVHWIAHVHGSASVSGGQLFVFRITFYILTSVAVIWLTTVGALLFSFRAFSTSSDRAQSVANGAIYMSVLALSIIFNVAIIFPALLMLQPARLWNVLRNERHAVTPRQRFRAVYPREYNPSFATATCILAIVFASTFSVIFPLIGPAVTILIFLTLIAHRYLIGYVYGRTHSQTGGLLQIWVLKRFGTLLAFQPILLGLIFLSRRFWIEGGVLTGSGVAVIFFIEAYTGMKLRETKRGSLSAITQDSLNTFETGAWNMSRTVDDEGTSRGSNNVRELRFRGSMASVLEMMSLTLAVMPSNGNYRGPVPLRTETLDDLTATERAARTHPDAPPHLPPLPFAEHAEEMAGILYAPELIAPPPIIWLPNDSAGVARSEAVDLQKYHDLAVTLDVRAKEDVDPRLSSSLRRRDSR